MCFMCEMKCAPRCLIARLEHLIVKNFKKVRVTLDKLVV